MMLRYLAMVLLCSLTALPQMVNAAPISTMRVATPTVRPIVSRPVSPVTTAVSRTNALVARNNMYVLTTVSMSTVFLIWNNGNPKDYCSKSMILNKTHTRIPCMNNNL